MKLTKNFQLEELCTTSEKALASKNLKEAKAHLTEMECLAFFAEQVRAFVNGPMIISSGFRCDELNKAVGGAKTSQHRFFRAIDFIPKGQDLNEIYDKLMISPLVYKQLIKEQSGGKRWIHVSMGFEKENLIYKDGKYTRI
jgi:hypothetical protein